MANDPLWIPSGVSGAATSCKKNCCFEWDFTLVASKDLEEDEEILVECGFGDNEDEKKPAAVKRKIMKSPEVASPEAAMSSNTGSI